MTSPSSSPSESEPGPWVHASSVTKNVPPTLNTASTSPSASILRALPLATPDSWHSSIRLGAADIGPLALISFCRLGRAFPQPPRSYYRHRHRFGASHAEERAE